MSTARERIGLITVYIKTPVRRICPFEIDHSIYESYGHSISTTNLAVMRNLLVVEEPLSIKYIKVLRYMMYDTS